MKSGASSMEIMRQGFHFELLTHCEKLMKDPDIWAFAKSIKKPRRLTPWRDQARIAAAK
jgi:hypothetical protein